jgi:predicted transcriptional regulator
MASKAKHFVTRTLVTRQIIRNFKARGMKQKEIALLMGMSCPYVCMLLGEKRVSAFELGEKLSGMIDAFTARVKTREDYRREEKQLARLAKDLRLYCV